MPLAYTWGIHVELTELKLVLTQDRGIAAHARGCQAGAIVRTAGETEHTPLVFPCALGLILSGTSLCACETFVYG